MEIKINLASGQRPYPKPWVNVDAIEQFDSNGQKYALDVQTDAKNLHMFDDNSVDIIVAHHLVEHIAIHDLDTYLSEWWRVLKPGGILSIHVPNIRELDKAWLEGRIDTYIHNVNTYGAYQGHVEDLHKWAYDHAELDARMSCGGKFNWQIQPFNLLNPIYAGADISMDWWILNREYVK